MDIREHIDPERLAYLDGIAQIVARLYQENMSIEQLGDKPDELRNAVYSLGQAYMILYNELLKHSDLDALEEEDEKSKE